ncbi:MAG: restriction endonuclease [Lentisphaeria bacterium]|nr:restriction endonuclease [Lentisphaeria bacterium]
MDGTEQRRFPEIHEDKMPTAPTNSRFYKPCLEILTANSPTAMGVSQIIKAVMEKYPELNWTACNGAVRANLLRMAKMPESPICLAEGTKPPEFYVKRAATFSAQPKRAETVVRQINSIFYEPCLEILREHAPKAMSANDVMKEVIARHPDLEWSRSQGPIRAMLLSASEKEGTGIRRKPDTTPPLFFYKKPSGNASAESRTVEAPPEEIMGMAYQQTIDSLRAKLREIIDGLEPTPFEHLANRVIAKILFGKAEDTPPSGDGGIDGFVHIHQDPLGLNVIGIQAKHYNGHNVQSDDIQKFIGALHHRNGVFVTSADFSTRAREEARIASPEKVVLVTGDELINYMIRHKVGVRDTDKIYTISKIDEEFFNNL